MLTPSMRIIAVLGHTTPFFLTLVYPENTDCFITKLLSMYLMEQHGLVMDLKQSDHGME